MADVKNFGLIGVGSSLQFSKAGPKLVNNSGVFNFKAANGTTDTALTAAGITSSAGNVTLTTGNLVLSATDGTFSVGGDTTISRQQSGVFQFNGTAATMLPTGTTAQEPTGAFGMVRGNTENNVLEYFASGVWHSVADTGLTTALQTEVDAIETSLGGAINSAGVFVPAGFTNVSGVLVTPTSFTNAIQQVANAVNTDNSLDHMFPSTAAGNVIYSNGSNLWVQAAPGSASGVQAYDLGLTNLAAKTTTGYLVQTGADTFTSVQLAAAGGLTVSDSFGLAGTTTFGTTGNLAALNSFAGTGIVVLDGSGVFQGRTIISTASGISFTNGNGVAGNPSLGLSGNMLQLDGLSGVGFLVRHTDGTISEESITGSAGRIVVTTGDGDTANPTVDLATVSQATSGNFVKVTLDGYGRVTGNTAVGTSDITSLVNSQYIRQDGTSPGMTGSLDLGSNTIVNVAAPVNPTDAANKAYVDNAVSGLSWKEAVSVIAAGNVVIAGPGATVDGVTLANGDRVLLKGQTTASENGIYVFNGAAVAMTRAADALTPVSLQGAAVFAEAGTYANTAWVQTIDPLASFAAQIWQQFSGAGSYVGSGAITVSGTTIGLTSGNGLSQGGGTLVVTTAGAITAASGSVALTLDTTATGGLDQTGNALRIKASSVTNAMLVSSLITLNADSGTGGVDLGNTLTIGGTSGQGISVSVSGTDPSTFLVTAANASASQKGVASFNAASFATTSGDVTIKAAGVTNTQLVNSAISLAGNAGSGTVSLGGTLTVSSADTAITATASGAGVSLQLNTVDVAHGGTGVTSFVANEVMYANASSAFAQSANFTFDGTSTLTVGGALPLAFNGALGSISATAANSDLTLMPNGTGSVIVGPVGAGLIQSDAGTALTVRGNTTLTLASGTGSTSMVLAAGTTAKVSVSGPTASDYATSLAANDLTNKQYVDNAIAAGASAGAVKAFQATIPLHANGTTNIGTAMPAGATVLSVKVMVTTVDASATLSVGKSGSVAAYMTTAENDTQANGLYLAECFVTESGSVQLIGTVAGSTGTGSGSCVVIVQYQVAQ